MTESAKKQPFTATKTTSGATVTIAVSLNWSELLKHRAHVLKDLQGKINLPGFRKGHVPEDVLIKQIGKTNFFEEMAEHTIEDLYPEILVKEDVKPLAYPKIELTKLVEDEPVEFTITVDVFPDIKLADYKKLASNENLKKVEAIEVTDKEVEKAIDLVRKQRAGSNEGVEEEIDDSFAQALGATDLADFKEKVRTELVNEKTRKQVEKKRIAILEAISAESVIDVPSSMIENELMRIKAQMSDNLAQMGMKFEEYIKQVKKSESELFTEWRPDAEKRVRFELTLTNIADIEAISPTEEDVEKEAKHLMEHYKDITIDQAFGYATNQLRKQKTFEFLESLK